MTTPNPIMSNVSDDFGNEIHPVNMSVDAMNRFFRFFLDGMIEGISDGVLTGNADDSAMRFFGLIQ
jgi:hypothetical protein